MPEAWDLPPLLPVKFPPPLVGTSHLDATGVDLGPPSQPRTRLHQHHVPKQTPTPGGCHRGVCALPSRAWEQQSNFPGSSGAQRRERRSRSLLPSPAPGPDAARPPPLGPGCSGPGGARRPRASPGSAPSASLCLPAPRRSLPAFFGSWRVSAAWPHITSRKGERGGAGPPLRPAPPASSVTSRSAPPARAPARAPALPARRPAAPAGVPRATERSARLLWPSQVSAALSRQGETAGRCFRLDHRAAFTRRSRI